MTTYNSTPPSFDWKPLFVALLIALTTLFALFAASCASSKVERTLSTQTLEVSRGDSVAHLSIDHAMAVKTYQSIAADTARMSIPLTSLRELPTEAVFTQKQGRARVDVKVRDNTLYVDASCDSLQRLVEYYAAMAAQYQLQASTQQDLHKETTEQHIEKKKLPAALFLLGVLIVACILVFLSILIKRIKP